MKLIDVCIKAALLLCVFSFRPAIAQEIGRGLICNEKGQAVRFMDILEDDAELAVEQVNAEAKSSNACGFGAFAFIRGSTVAEGRGKKGSYRIIEITVIGVPTPFGMRSVPPQTQFTIVKGAREEGA